MQDVWCVGAIMAYFLVIFYTLKKNSLPLLCSFIFFKSMLKTHTSMRVLLLSILLCLGQGAQVFHPPADYLFDTIDGLYVSWNTSHFTGTSSLQVSILTAALADVSWTTSLTNPAAYNGEYTINSAFAHPGNIARELSQVFLLDDLGNSGFSATFDVASYATTQTLEGELGQTNLLLEVNFLDFATSQPTPVNYYFDNVWLGTFNTQVLDANHHNVPSASSSIPVPQVAPGTHTIRLVAPDFADIANASYDVTIVDTTTVNSHINCRYASRGTCGTPLASQCSATPFGFCNQSANASFPTLDCTSMTSTTNTSCGCVWPWNAVEGTACMDTTPLTTQTAEGQACDAQGTCTAFCPSILEECQTFCGQGANSISFQQSQCMCGDTGMQCTCALGEYTCPTSKQCFGFPENVTQTDNVTCQDIEEYCVNETDAADSPLCTSGTVSFHHRTPVHIISWSLVSLFMGFLFV